MVDDKKWILKDSLGSCGFERINMTGKQVNFLFLNVRYLFDHFLLLIFAFRYLFTFTALFTGHAVGAAVTFISVLFFPRTDAITGEGHG